MEIELIAVEPEVALTISKGDSLIFKIAKVDINKAKQIRGALDLLRADWLQLKSRAEVCLIFPNLNYDAFVNFSYLISNSVSVLLP